MSRDLGMRSAGNLWAPAEMRKIGIILTSPIEGGTAPFSHEDLEVVFHMRADDGSLPLIEGSLWVFIDWILPDISGQEVCRRLRCDPLTAQAHLTMILGDDDVSLRRAALTAGADDYMMAPVTRTAILDRVMARRLVERETTPAQTLKLGELTVDVAAFRARVGGKPVELMPNEFRLLRFLVEHPGRVFTRSQLISALGKHDAPVDERTVDVWIGRLRRALRASGSGDMLRTVRSVGYVLDLP
jgi:two-component system phosphate regulon response regulator PhoB